MPQSNEGVLLVIGALFLLLGLLGGGFEISAIKVPPIGKYTRGFAFLLGVIVFGVGLFRLLIPVPVTPPIVVPPAAVTPTTIALPATATPIPATDTPPAPTPPPKPTPKPTLAPTLTPSTARATGRIKDVSVTYDQTRFERRGMVIHVNFTVSGLKDVESKAVANFFQRTGEALEDQNGVYVTVEGTVSASATFTPGYEVTVYDDLEIFMPYDELELGPGSYELKFYVQLFDLRDTSQGLASSPYIDFDFTK